MSPPRVSALPSQSHTPSSWPPAQASAGGAGLGTLRASGSYSWWVGRALQGRLAPLRDAQKTGSAGQVSGRGPQSPRDRAGPGPTSSALRPPGGSVVKNPPALQETPVPSLGAETPGRREWLPSPVF